MKPQQLWFVRYDALVCDGLVSYESLARLGQPLTSDLPFCSDTGLQLHTYQLLKAYDEFLNPEKLSSFFLAQHNTSTDAELTEAEKQITLLRMLIQIDKAYAIEYWLNRKLDWNTQMRILASLCRLYLLLVRVHSFLTYPFDNLWERARYRCLIVPINHVQVTEKSELQEFVNRAHRSLCQVQEFYYRYEYPYIREIHVMCERWRVLLKEFPNLKREDVLSQMPILDVVSKQNKRYSKLVIQKAILNNNKKHQEQPRKQKYKRYSLNRKNNKPFEFLLQYGFKSRRTQSLCVFQRQQKDDKEKPKLILTQIVRVNILSRKRTQQSSTLRSFTQINSTREITESRPNIIESINSRDADNSEKKSRVSSRAKPTSRRTMIPVKSRSRATIDQKQDERKVEFKQDALVELESHSNTIKLFYDDLKKKKSQDQQLKISISVREDSPRRGKLSHMVSSKFGYIQKRAVAVVLSNGNIRLEPPSQAECGCL